MRIDRLISLILVFSILSSFFIVKTVNADDTIENLVVAEFNINFVTGTDLDVEVIMNAQRLTTDETYTADEIKNADDLKLGAFSFLLYQMLERQLEETFKNADILNFSMPTFDGNNFNEELNVKLTSSFFGLNDSVNVHDFINGVLDISSFVNYSLNLQVEPGWNNTYMMGLGQNLDYKRTTGVLDGDNIKWIVKNWDGNTPNMVAEIQLKGLNPTTPTLESEDIFLEFVLDSKLGKTTSLTIDILVKSADIRVYDIMPDFITNLDFVPADGLRLFISNGLISWSECYDKTIKPLEESIVSTIRESSFNQTLDTIFSWDNETTTDCLIPYEISNMDDSPSAKALLTDDQISLKICDISSKALFGLINAGGEANISEEDINFGEDLDKIGYDYKVTLYLPENLYLDGENVYIWNESIPISGIFESDDSPNYLDEEKDTVIEITVETTDLNLLSFFTGKTELTFGLNMKETRNYNITTLPEGFTIPEKVSINYLNSDAFRLCVEEGVFSDTSVNNFLKDEKTIFENTLKHVILNLKINANINRGIFDESLEAWDGEISNMDATPPVKTASYAHSTYPVSFDLSFIPPGFDIPTKTFNFTGLPNQYVTYKVIFPHGLTIHVSDSLKKAVVKEMEDGRKYIEIIFSPSEDDLTIAVSCKMTPSPLFVIGVFMPCIVCLLIAIILIIVIYFIRKKRKGRKSKMTVEEDITGYEEEDYYVPPPPGSK